ncbi:UNVERIFIED_CONTAM: Transcription factor [Sesamum radiatum]|uniref:Transcription factor n=1 Tax=Sesamum radiatum TaxID=300843 RepID=A0AAW2M7S8_SESRA
MEDYNFDYEMFDLKPIIPEIYTTVVHQQQPQTFGRSNAGNGMRMMVMGSSTSWNSCDAHQIIMNTNPSSSSSNSSPAAATATASAPPQLISFQNTSSYLPTHSDTAPNCDNYNLEMSKDYISGTPQVISFCAANWADEDDCGRPDNQYHDAANIGVSNKRVCTASRTPLQAQDHLVAERKRRERLGQLFITLSKVVPGLKKLDKASLLEDAINYLKALQERVNALEEEDQVVKKSSNMDDDHDHNSSSHNYNNIGSTISTTDQSSAEIRARISNRHVLIKICCRKQMGLISRIPCEMEKMHLSVIDMRVMPFGGAALDITILAEMHSEFRGTVKEIVGHLQMSFLKAAA